MMKKAERQNEKLPIVRSGPGGLCRDAQADGVPCATLDRDCEECDKAAPRPRWEKDWQPTDTA